MAKVFRVIGQVAGVVATVAAFVPGGQAIAAIATAVSAVSSISAQVLAKPPAARGQITERIIGANNPLPYLMGRSYSGGVQVHDVGYGGEVNGVDNPYRFLVTVHSCAGPVEQIESTLANFSQVTFSGTAATGYYNDYWWRDTQLGARPEADALAPNFAGAPRWGASYKLSGFCAVGHTFKWSKKGKRFAGGQLPILGEIVRGVKVYDPRLDSTYPGGSGSQRINNEATWAYSRNPALHALTYAYGRYVNGVKVFGVDLGSASIDLSSAVAWANVCDANGWSCDGTIYEPGNKWENLKRICQSGGAQPVLIGGVLRFDYQAPRTALATITRDDLASGPLRDSLGRGWKDRHNTIVPRYRSENHQWEYVQSDAVSVPAFVTEDGEIKRDEIQYDLVTNKDQAAELATYELYQRRELGPINFPLKPHFRSYDPGDCFTLSADLSPNGQPIKVVMRSRSVDVAGGIISCTFETENDTKHVDALGALGTEPTSFTFPTAEELDDTAAINTSAANTIYSDGLTSVEELRPAEAGATVGAVLPPPGAIDPGAGVVGNIRDHLGEIYDPGELLNSSLELTADGQMQYRPLPSLPPVSVGRIELPDLGAASVEAMRRAEDDVDALANALATALDEASRTRETFTDAGFFTDPVTGQVRIHAIEQTAERVSSAEVRLDAAEANINLRATVNYVDQAIASAVLDPSQIADLDAIFVRLTAAELDIDGLNATVTTLATATELSLVEGRVTTAEQAIDALEGTVTTKVDTTTFNALETRVTSAESTLSAIGDTAQIVNTLTSVRLVERDADANAEGALAALVQGDRNQRDQVAAIASARQELRTDISDGLTAEAAARLALQVEVQNNTASLATESLTRATEDAALAAQITALTASTDSDVATLTASIQSEQTARTNADDALAASITSLSAELDDEIGNRAASITAEQQARIDGDALIAAGLAQQVTAGRVVQGEADDLADQLLGALVRGDVNRREINGALAGVRQEITTQIIEDREAVAANLLALVARLSDAESSIVTEQQARVNGDGALAASITSLNTQVGDNTATLVTFGESLDGLEARQGVRLDVNGRITGYVQNNDGAQGNFIVVADNFKVVDPDTGAAFIDADENGLKLQNGRVIMDNGLYIKAVGVGFGTSGQFIEWFGPRPTGGDLALCTEANALAYLKTNGDAYFGGSLSAGVLRNAARSTSIAANASVEIGPFGTNGNPIQVITGFGVQSGFTTDYPATSQGLTDWEAAVTAWGATATGPVGDRSVNASKAIACNVTVRVDRALGTGTPAQWATLTITAGTETLVGTAPTPNDAPGSLTYTRTVNGSITSTDNAGGIQNRLFVATITARTNATIGTIQNQTVSLTATEE